MMNYIRKQIQFLLHRFRRRSLYALAAEVRRR
jgi:hypothetical protein